MLGNPGVRSISKCFIPGEHNKGFYDINKGESWCHALGVKGVRVVCEWQTLTWTKTRKGESLGLTLPRWEAM